LQLIINYKLTTLLQFTREITPIILICPRGYKVKNSLRWDFLGSLTLHLAPDDADQPPIISKKELPNIQRAVLVYLTFCGIPKDFDYNKTIIDHMNEINYDNHIDNLHPLLKGVNTIPRCKLPSNNRSGYIGVYERANKWYYQTFIGNHHKCAGTKYDALYGRFESEVKGGMYTSYSPSHIIAMLVGRPGMDILLKNDNSLHEDTRGLDLFIKVFIKSSIGREYNQPSDNIHDDNDLGVTGDDGTTPLPGSNRGRQKTNKVTPSPHPPNHQTPSKNGPPQIRRQSKTNAIAVCIGKQTAQNTQPCCNEKCNTNVSIPIDHDNNKVVQYCCETCIKLATEQQYDYYNDNRDDGTSLDHSIISGLILAGKLPKGLGGRDVYIERFTNDLHDFMRKHANNDKVEIGRDYDTINELVFALADGYNNVRSLLDGTEDNNGSISVQRIMMMMYGWKYNVDVYEWITKPYGFELINNKSIECQGEQSAHANINIIRRLDANGFDSLDLSFSGIKEKKYSAATSGSNNDGAGGVVNPAAVGGDHVDRDDLNDLVAGHDNEQVVEEQYGYFFQDGPDDESLIGINNVSISELVECEQMEHCPTSHCNRVSVTLNEGEDITDFVGGGKVPRFAIVGAVDQSEAEANENSIRPGKSIRYVIYHTLYHI